MGLPAWTGEPISLAVELPERGRVRAFVAAHPVVAGLAFVMTVGGALAGVYVAPADWHAARGAALGALLGFWFAAIIVGWRMLAIFAERRGPGR